MSSNVTSLVCSQHYCLPTTYNKMVAPVNANDSSKPLQIDIIYEINDIQSIDAIKV